MTSPIVVALDFPGFDQAMAMARQLDPQDCRVKVGKELFTRCGRLVRMHELGFEVFLDLKFHDINTTAMASRAAELGVWMVNALQRRLKMMASCREVLEQHQGNKPLLIGVTVLTSMEQDDLAGIGLDVVPQEQVLAWPPWRSRSGWTAGVFGAGGAGAETAVDGRPGDAGIRPAGSASDDQKRILTPAQAMQAGLTIWLLAVRLPALPSQHRQCGLFWLIVADLKRYWWRNLAGCRTRAAGKLASSPLPADIPSDWILKYN